jgi:putative FmdB family regulatory protein
MPIYEYQCGECDHVFDALQKMSDDPLTDCPDCGKPELRKLMSAPNFRLKGAGWYETDFKDKNQRNLAGGSDAKSSDANSSKDKNSDGKPADKSSEKGATKLGSKTEGAKPSDSKSSGSSSGSSE